MRLVSFDPFRTLGIPGVTYVKPALYLQHLDLIRAADWLLFPEYWQVNSLAYAYRKRVFPSIPTYHLGHDKVEMTRALEGRWPRHIPRTLIRAACPEAADEILETLGLPLVVKDVRSSGGRGVALIERESDWHEYCAGRRVLYAQAYLPIDRDLRVVVIGREVVASYWRVQSAGGFLNNLAAGGELDFSPPPVTAVALVQRIARALRIDHAGFDVAMLGGRPYVLEFNRLFGNRGLLEQGVRQGDLILDYLRNRTGTRPRRDDGRRAA